jgi:hypothetical protein
VLPTSKTGNDVRMIEVGDGTGFGQIGFGGFGAIHEFAVRRAAGKRPENRSDSGGESHGRKG